MRVARCTPCTAGEGREFVIIRARSNSRQGTCPGGTRAVSLHLANPPQRQRGLYGWSRPLAGLRVPAMESVEFDVVDPTRTETEETRSSSWLHRAISRVTVARRSGRFAQTFLTQCLKQNLKQNVEIKR